MQVSRLQKIITLIGSFGFTGFFPVAPATFASFVFIVIYLFVPGGKILASPYLFFPLLLASVPVASSMEKHYGHDAGCIVIDEIVAMQLILLGVQTGITGGLLAFFFFRVFDVVKPFPVGRSQLLPRGYGVVMDDILAALYTRIALFVVALIFPGIGRFGF